MTTKKNPAIPTAEMLKEWAEDTDINNHTEVRVKIAKWAYENSKEKTDNWWDLKSAYEACKEMQTIQDADKSINRIQWSCLAITNNLFDLIEREYGARTRKLIKCL